jgi:hypothetical protein
VCFEVDCATLVSHWNNRANDRSVIRPILEEISELGGSFSSFSVGFARREANQTAHCCPKSACIQKLSNIWNAEPLRF